MSLTCAQCYGVGYTSKPLWSRGKNNQLKDANLIFRPCLCKISASKRARRALKLLDDIPTDNSGWVALSNKQFYFILKVMKRNE